VRSIVGRFLEHTRVFWFLNGGEGPLTARKAGDTDEIVPGSGEVFCASADWMERNFFKRVEVAFPIEHKKLHERVVREALNSCLKDNTQAWALHADGSYRQLTPDGAEPFSAQASLIKELSESV
jgi:polyphosphate kinase